MKNIFCIAVLLLLLVEPVDARPSFRSIREQAESTGNNSDAGWRMQFFHWEEYGLRTTYPESWKDPVVSAEQGYIEARILPHNNVLGQRKNYLLELITSVWDTGEQLSKSELETYAREHTPSRFREFYWGDVTERSVAGYPAWNFTFSTMTGKREETWVSIGRYVYVIGYRARNEEYFEADHFFYEDFVNSVKITPVAESPNPKPNPNPLSTTTTNSQLSTLNSVFSDIPPTHPYAEAIAWAKENDVIGGYPDESFQPDRTVNRAEFLKIILEAADIAAAEANSDFPDVPKDAWFAGYVAAGQDFGIIQGYPDGTFKPEKTVNTAEALKMAYKALNIATKASNGPWYEEFFDHATQNDILFEALSPENTMKRKDVVWIVWRLSQ